MVIFLSEVSLLVPERSPAVAQLFYSYAHKDEKLRDRLEVHLAALKREGLISGWHDRKIGAGTEWKNAIDDHLKAASIILLLVSADFLASDYCYDVELRYAMERHQKGKARVIPVILQPCDWHTSAFASLQAVPKDGKPVTKWPNRNDAFVNVAAGIRKALEGLSHGVSPATPPKQTAASTTSSITPAFPPMINALHGLPAPPADFTGRASELAELLEGVKAGGVTISGLQGMSGVGKTALALKLADQLKADYPDAQFYLNLKGVTQPLSPKEAMAHVIRVWHPTAQLPEKEEDLAPLYRSVLDGKRALLLMDNARDADQVRPLLPPSGCLLVVTSRKHFTLPGLVEQNLDKLPHADACVLLLKIAPRLGREKKEVLESLATLCGHLPLALEKVANALQIKKNLAPADYAQRLSDARNRLKLTETDAALQQSYDLLPQRLQRRFRFLAVFPDTFNLSAAAAILEMKPDKTLDQLAELLAYSVIEYDETMQRYHLHDLVRLFGEQRLTPEERTTAEKRHAGHYLKVLSHADQLYLKGGESVLRGLALFDLERGNIQGGQSWAVMSTSDDNDSAELCWRYPDAGAYCLGLRQHPRERIRWLEAGLTAARKLKRRDWECNALGNLGLAYFELGDYGRAIGYHKEVLKFERELGDRLREGQSLGHLGNAHLSLHEYRPAIEYYKESLKILHEIGERRSESIVLGNIGCAYGGLDDHRRAIEYHEQSLQICRSMGNRKGEGDSLGNLGNAYRNFGEHRRSLEFYEQVLQIAREMGDRLSEANALFNGALAFDALKDRDKAIPRAEAALKIYETIEAPAAARVRAVLSEWRKEK